MPGMGFQPKNWYRIHFSFGTFLYYFHSQMFYRVVIERSYPISGDKPRSKVDSGEILGKIVEDVVQIWPEVALDKVMMANHLGENILTPEVLKQISEHPSVSSSPAVDRTANSALLENSTVAISLMQCLIKSRDEASMQFLYNYSLTDNVNALKGNFISRMKKSHGQTIRMEELVVTFAGRQLSPKQNISRLRIPYVSGDRTMTYDASNEPFVVFKSSLMAGPTQ